MGKDIKKLNEFLNEGISSNPINYKKLVEYANGIAICCAGEYGIVYYNEKHNHVFVCLGDSHPFEEKYLESFMKEYIKKDYDSMKDINITIENECGPSDKEEGWVKIN